MLGWGLVGLWLQGERKVVTDRQNAAVAHTIDQRIFLIIHVHRGTLTASDIDHIEPLILLKIT